MQNLIQLIYASSATRLFTQQELIDLLHSARDNNKKLNITGMLLYRDGNFLQVLEGEAQAVDTLYAEISKDPRHRNVMLISRHIVPHRTFPDWEMGFTDVESLNPAQYPGYTDFMQSPFTPNYLAGNPSRAMIFLETFKGNDYVF